MWRLMISVIAVGMGGNEEESVLALSDGHFATREHWARAYANTWDGTSPTTLNYYGHIVTRIINV